MSFIKVDYASLGSGVVVDVPLPGSLEEFVDISGSLPDSELFISSGSVPAFATPNLYMPHPIDIEAILHVCHNDLLRVSEITANGPGDSTIGSIIEDTSLLLWLDRQIPLVSDSDPGEAVCDALILVLLESDDSYLTRSSATAFYVIATALFVRQSRELFGAAVAWMRSLGAKFEASFDEHGLIGADLIDEWAGEVYDAMYSEFTKLLDRMESAVAKAEGKDV